MFELASPLDKGKGIFRKVNGGVGSFFDWHTPSLFSIACSVMWRSLSKQMAHEPTAEFHSDAWLEANGHDRDWLEQWLAEPVIDHFAVKEWMAHHKNSDPRLRIKLYRSK